MGWSDRSKSPRVPASKACWLVAEIDSRINAALACSSLPPQLQELALRAGPAGQLEVSSLQHSKQHGSGLCLLAQAELLLLSPSQSFYVENSLCVLVISGPS